DRVIVYRLDRAAATCTRLVFQEALGACALGLASGSWCLSNATVSADTASCEARQSPTGTVVAATAVTGAFTVTAGATPVVAMDVTLEFPGGGALPPTVHASASGCSAACSVNDCRR